MRARGYEAEMCSDSEPRRRDEWPLGYPWPVDHPKKEETDEPLDTETGEVCQILPRPPRRGRMCGLRPLSRDTVGNA